MNKAFCKIIVLLSLAVIISCAPKPKITQIAVEQNIPVPHNLEGKAINGKATISWEIDRPKNFVSGGYNIYLSEISSPDNDRLYNSVPFPGDTDGDASKETFEIEGLTNGRFYEVWVRMLSADGRLGAESERKVFRPLEMGLLTVYFDMLHDSSGYSFAKRKYTKARDFYNDFYLYEKEGPHISSPSLYNSGLRETYFADLSGSYPRSPIKFAYHVKISNQTSMALARNNIYAVRTQQGIAEIKIKDFIGSGNQKRTIIKYLYFPFGDDSLEIDADSLSRNLTD